MGFEAHARELSDDRIDVTDAAGHRLGWVDPHSERRTLLDPHSRDVFDDVVDFWMTAAGLATEPSDDPAGDDLPLPHAMRVTEVRYPDATLSRTLVIPLLPGD